MSTSPKAYRQLKANPDLVRKIARVEADNNAREMQYLPKAQLAAAQPRLRTGDIVGVTTTIDGLDCGHSGLCYRDLGIYAAAVYRLGKGVVRGTAEVAILVGAAALMLL